MTDINPEQVQWFNDNWPDANAKPKEIREAHRKLNELDWGHEAIVRMAKMHRHRKGNSCYILDLAAKE